MKMPLWLCGLFTLWMWLVSVSAHPEGAPESACEHMFPMGHGADAMTSDPPYALEVTGGPINKYHHELTVTLKVKNDSGATFFKGMFVQARMASCYNEKSFGTFSLLDKNDSYLEVMDCGGNKASAVTHKTNTKIFDGKTFQWFSPNTSHLGHMYFRATVVKNKTTFWTNVFSDIIEDKSDNRPVPTKYCDVCNTPETCSASSFSAMTSLIIAAFGLALNALLW